MFPVQDLKIRPTWMTVCWTWTGYWQNKDKVPDARASLQEIYKDIPKAVGISKEKYGMIIKHFFIQGKESENVARELNVPEYTVKSAVSFHLKYNLPKTGIFSTPNKSNFITSSSRTNAGSRSIVLTPEQEEILVQYKRHNTSATLKELQSLVREDRVSFPQITNIGLSTLYYILKRHGMNTSRRRYKFNTTV
ncbi:uncharacterized protein LOC143256355 [Tachypleus tridentatus]|uniref:uncharacterized protein LOC143256355 n=1 Tax=Tachypleus tridentatus TaxID=6853 RepID=UPI003FD3E5FA